MTDFFIELDLNIFAEALFRQLHARTYIQSVYSTVLVYGTTPRAKAITEDPRYNDSVCYQ